MAGMAELLSPIPESRMAAPAAQPKFRLNFPRPQGVGRLKAYSRRSECMAHRQHVGQSGHWGSVPPTAAMGRSAVVALEVGSYDHFMDQDIAAPNTYAH